MSDSGPPDPGAREAATAEGEAHVRPGGLKLFVFWAFVMIPLAWGVFETAQRAAQLF